MSRAKSFFFTDEEIVTKKKRKTSKRQTSPKIFDCNTCGLYKDCQSPKMEPHGRNELSIAIIAEAPGAKEDQLGIPLVGQSGQLLRKHFRNNGIDLDRDCVKLNIIQCRPPGNRTPTSDEIASCRIRVNKQLDEIKPLIILALGTPAIVEMLTDAPSSPIASIMHGRAIPCKTRNAWIVCSYHPSFFLHKGNQDEILLDQAVKIVVDKIKDPTIVEPLNEDNYEILEDLKEVEAYFASLTKTNKQTALDYETTRVSPYMDDSKMLLVSFANDIDKAIAIPLEHPQARWTKPQLEQLYKMIANFLQSNVPKIIQNWSFEELWTRQKLGVSVNNVICDTMVRQHVLDGRTGTTGLEFQTYVRYGTTYKGAVDTKTLSREPLDKVAKYGAMDSCYTLRLKKDQDNEISDSLQQAYEFFHKAIPVMTNFEHRGLLVNVEAMDKLEVNVLDEIKTITDTRKGLKVLKTFEKKEGKVWNSGSSKDKQKLFYDILQMKSLKPINKKTGNISVDMESIEYLLGQATEGSESYTILKGLSDESSLNKLHGTYIKGLKKLLDTNDLLHPSFNLHTVRTYRSSSSDPNFQNLPIRKPTLARVRKTMIPSLDYFLEVDYAGIEVRVIAMMSKDPVLINEILNDIDTHRYWASRIFEKKPSDITKEERFDGKNSLVFPLFYGSYFVNIAKSLGMPERHIKKVEDEFWSKYKGVKKWQDALVSQYKQKGFVETPLGFKRHAPIKKNKVINSPVQATGFHLLLDALIRIENDYRMHDMKSNLFGQIHDSGDFDVAANEVEDVISIAEEHLLSKRFGWMSEVPLAVEWKIGKNFLEMETL